MDDHDESFEHVVGSQYGQMEAAMGADGYAAFVKARDAEGITMKAHAEKINAQTSAIRIGTLMFVLACIPTFVWLWKWALDG